MTKLRRTALNEFAESGGEEAFRAVVDEFGGLVLSTETTPGGRQMRARNAIITCAAFALAALLVAIALQGKSIQKILLVLAAESDPEAALKFWDPSREVQ